MTTKTTIKSVVLATYSKVLGAAPSRLSAGGDFVSLGGNSSLSAEIAASLMKTYPGLKTQPEDVLRCQTVAGMVDLIKRQGIR